MGRYDDLHLTHGVEEEWLEKEKEGEQDESQPDVLVWVLMPCLCPSPLPIQVCYWHQVGPDLLALSYLSGLL